MKFLWFWILLLHFLCGLQLCVGVAPKGHPKETKTQSVEKLLIRKLLSRYERFGVIGRPVNDSKIKVVVSFGVQVFQILDLDENKQILRTNCWGMYKWHDSLLEWNPKLYRDIASVRFFPSQIWTPDIKLYNFADERLKEHREARVVIYSDGSTLWVPQALFKSTCEVEISYFPFDTQICMLEFGSWTYDKTQMDIVWWQPDGPESAPMPYLDFSDYTTSNEWRTDGELERKLHHLNRTIQIRSVKKYRRRNHTVGSEVVTREYPVLRYLVRLRRNPSFYVFMLVIPCVLLSSLTMVVFWLPPESPAKMMLGMNIFVAFFVLLLLLAESTPSAVKNFPLIGVFFCINMIMITLSTFLATLVIHLHFRGDRNGAVPAFLRRFVIEGIGRLIWVRQRIPLPEVRKTSSPRPKSHSNKSKVRLTNCSTIPGCQFTQNESSFYGPQSPLDQSFPNIAGQTPIDYYIRGTQCQNHPAYYDPSLAYLASSGTGSKFDQVPYPMNNSGHSMKPDPTKTAAIESEDSTNIINSTATLERDVREVKRYVKIFVNRQKEMQRKSLGAMEWRTLALVLDRLFFFVYVATIAISVLVGIPKTTEPELPEAFREDSYRG